VDEVARKLTMRWMLEGPKDRRADRALVGPEASSPASDEQLVWDLQEGESLLARHLRASRLVC
jgi:hypothetical protein